VNNASAGDHGRSGGPRLPDGHATRADMGAAPGSRNALNYQPPARRRSGLPVAAGVAPWMARPEPAVIPAQPDPESRNFVESVASSAFPVEPKDCSIQAFDPGISGDSVSADGCNSRRVICCRCDTPNPSGFSFLPVSTTRVTSVRFTNTVPGSFSEIRLNAFTEDRLPWQRGFRAARCDFFRIPRPSVSTGRTVLPAR